MNQGDSCIGSHSTAHESGGLRPTKPTRGISSSYNSPWGVARSPATNTQVADIEQEPL